jgi:hypothetical protein
VGLVDALREHAEQHDYGDVSLPDPSLDLDPKTHVINPHGLASSSWTAR